ncbi:MAG: YSC84-related protein [Woeseiaceae bacterium]|jgi:lipid-binding SYLF domain-containing protein
MKKYNGFFRLVALATAVLASATALAAPAEEIDRDANEALQVFREDIDGADVFLNQAAGYLVFPRVIKVGIGIGGETGEGVLRVGGKTVDYYRTSAGSIGFQLGAQAKSIVIAFMTPESLAKFRASSGWEAGVDGSVALIDIGAGKSINTNNIKDPVVGFVFGSKGLMYNLTLEGTKFSKLDKSK